MAVQHVSQSISHMLNDVFERNVRRLDTQLERGEITLRQHQEKLRHMVEAVS